MEWTCVGKSIGEHAYNKNNTRILVWVGIENNITIEIISKMFN